MTTWSDIYKTIGWRPVTRTGQPVLSPGEHTDPALVQVTRMNTMRAYYEYEMETAAVFNDMVRMMKERLR